eukprot:Pompholyxophrys_punicea_v1_NODE_318_length_2275_cov_16.666216.p4 type:complete len:128 gc:universal NODE_318_length_2275_cov_16.666216:407-790(+)
MWAKKYDELLWTNFYHVHVSTIKYTRPCCPDVLLRTSKHCGYATASNVTLILLSSARIVTLRLLSSARIVTLRLLSSARIVLLRQSCLFSIFLQIIWALHAISRPQVVSVRIMERNIRRIIFFYSLD